MKAKSEIEFGKRYRDKNTGFEGVANGVYFFQYGCTRVNLQSLAQGEVKECVFDEQGLVSVEDSKPVKSSARVGGPRPSPSTTGIR